MAWVSSRSDTWRRYSFGQTKKRGGVEQCWSSKPERLLLEQKGFCPARWGHPGCKTLQMWKGKDQPAPSQMSEMDTPLDHAKEEAMPLMEWALTPIGHYNPEEEYANVIASTKHLEISCFATGPPLARLPKPKKSCFDFLYEAERSMYILRALTGQSRDSWLPVGGKIWKAL